MRRARRAARFFFAVFTPAFDWPSGRATHAPPLPAVATFSRCFLQVRAQTALARPSAPAPPVPVLRAPKSGFGRLDFRDN
jgi:hypothetical protein